MEQKVKETEIDYRKGTIDGKYAKYDRGDKINTLDELLKQDVFIWGNVTRNQAWLRCQQFNWIMEHVLGNAYKCVLKKKHKYNSNNNITRKEYLRKFDGVIDDEIDREKIANSIVNICKAVINSDLQDILHEFELPFSDTTNLFVMALAVSRLKIEYPFLDFCSKKYGYRITRYCIEWSLKKETK